VPISGNYNTFNLPGQIDLTDGQDYYWGIKAKINGKWSEKDSQFRTKQISSVEDPSLANRFSTVTILTSGIENTATSTELVNRQLALTASHIAQTDRRVPETEQGLVMNFDEAKGSWYWWNNGSRDYVLPTNTNAKALVLNTNLNLNSKLNLPQNVVGLAEGTADALFAALVKLDTQLGGTVGSYVNGNLVRTQGKLFNSSLHFIGVGQGAIINNEIIQRLGTYYPHAGGLTSIQRDLQMTTIDAPDLVQAPNRPQFDGEPTIKVWNNVTFADNYYQTITTNGNQNTLIGKPIDGADVNVNLSTLYQFGEDDDEGSSHLNALAWYAGTVNLSGKGGSDQKIYRRLGDLDSSNSSKIRPETWYSPANPGDIAHGATNVPWEGIETGWFYSVLGGGKDRRQPVNGFRTDVSFDNTVTARQRGDFAVPTLFNGNFDAITNRQNVQPIPGWSGLNQGQLSSWNDILPDGSPDRIVYANGINNNYTLKLNDGQSITHDSFVVPDWGVLRFDLHVPSANLNSGSVIVSVQSDVNGYENYPLGVVSLTTASTTPSQAKTNYLEDRYKIAYGTEGFETFHIDLPPALRGKNVKITFQVQGGTVYLDNVFFKSKNLVLGNPTLNNRQAGQTLPLDINNFLIEKPQYSLSFNSSEKISNWVAYELDKTWLGTFPKLNKSYWNSDPELPLIQANSSDFGVVYQLGHLVSESHRNRNAKDTRATYLMDDVLPQHSVNNSDFEGVPKSAWVSFEYYLKSLVNNDANPRKIYIISGSFPTLNNEDYQLRDPDGLFDTDGTPDPLLQNGVNVPSATWKIALILDANQSIYDISAQTRVISIVTPNLPYPPNLNTDINLPDNDPHNLTYWRNWRNFIKSVDFIENQTDLNFFTNLPSDIENILEAQQDNGLLSASLQANSNSSPLSIFQGSSLNDSFFKANNCDFSIIPFRPRQTSILEVNPITISFGVSFSEVSKTQIGVGEIDITQIGIPKVSIGQNSVSDTSKSPWSKTQSAATILPWVTADAWSFFEKERLTSSVVSTKVGTSEINLTQIGSIQVNPSQNSFAQIDSMKIDSSKVTLPSSISLQQLLSSQLPTHDLTSDLDRIYSTARSIWHTNTDLNLNFNITNLPTGQLAEATITGYDNNGRPNAATISIDDDANGVGWFIDSTPDDNSEFRAGTGTYFTANPDSAASGKYDLLTTILHEMGHTLGIINGYSEFDKYVRNNKFVTASGTEITLTPDGSHLDSTLYPYDLMNTTLKTGVRKLPSTMDWAMIDALNAGFEERASRLNY
jgi:large repetitive protein